MILNLHGLEESLSKEKVFVSVKQDHNRNFILFYKKIFHKDTTTIADYLAAVMAKQYKNPILYIFKSYYQDCIHKVIWDKDSIPKSKEE